MENITIFDNLSQAAEIANKEGKLGLQDSLVIYQSLVELSKALDIQDVLEKRAKDLVEAQNKGVEQPTSDVVEAEVLETETTEIV